MSTFDHSGIVLLSVHPFTVFIQVSVTSCRICASARLTDLYLWNVLTKPRFGDFTSTEEVPMVTRCLGLVLVGVDGGRGSCRVSGVLSLWPVFLAFCWILIGSLMFGSSSAQWTRRSRRVQDRFPGCWVRMWLWSLVVEENLLPHSEHRNPDSERGEDEAMPGGGEEDEVMVSGSVACIWRWAFRSETLLNLRPHSSHSDQTLRRFFCTGRDKFNSYKQKSMKL